MSIVVRTNDDDFVDTNNTITIIIIILISRVPARVVLWRVRFSFSSRRIGRGDLRGISVFNVLGRSDRIDVGSRPKRVYHIMWYENNLTSVSDNFFLFFNSRPSITNFSQIVIMR